MNEKLVNGLTVQSIQEDVHQLEMQNEAFENQLDVLKKEKEALKEQAIHVSKICSRSKGMISEGLG